jgi:hypothetical protein
MAGPPIPSVIDEAGIREVVPLMRVALGIGALLVFLAGLQLFVLTEHTGHWFAWTIALPLTAAFLGAFYWTSVPLAAMSATRRHWADARVAIPGVFVFLVLTFVTTVLHLGKFHLHDSDSVARGAAWLWLVIYAGDPLLLGVAWIVQHRAKGIDPERRAPVPAAYLGALWVQAVAILAIGAAMFVAPDAAARIWPWPLTPLTARAISSWLIGLALVLVSATIERDWRRLQPATTAYVVLGVLQGVAIARYPESIDWSRPSAWIYAAMVSAILVTGALGVLAARRARSPGAHPTASAMGA